MAAAAVLTAALALAGCTPSQPVTVPRTSVTIAVSAPLTSLNALSRTGNQPTDISVAALTGDSFTSYDATPALHANPDFGTVKKLSSKPLRVKYTIAPDVTWSDGTPVDAADLLLSWAAGSGVLDTVKPKTNAAGTVTNPSAVRAGVYFDSAGAPGLDEVSKVPTVTDDGRSITLRFDHPVADWRRALPTPLVPAHVVMQQAFPSRHYDAAAAKRAMTRALQEFTVHTLAPISTVWSHGFDVDGATPARGLRLSNGPYVVSTITKDVVTLTANPRYTSGTRPRFEKVKLRVIPDPLKQVAALKAGDVDVISPPVSAAVLAALGTSSASVHTAPGGAYEHLDLSFDNGGPFDASRYAGNPDRARAVRQAFLKTIPLATMVADAAHALSSTVSARDSFLAMPAENGYRQITRHNGAQAYRSVDIAGAQRLLARSQVTTPVPVRILIPDGDPLRETEFQRIAASAARAGFTVVKAASAPSSASWRDRLGDGSYDAAVFAWAEHDLTVAGSQTVFAKGGSHNLNGFSSALVDTAFGDLANGAGADDRVTAYTRIDAALYADAYGLPVYQFPTVVAYDRRVGSVATHPLPPGLFGTIPAWSPRH
jgi:peptide/nickel transport system substrate-binding protein